jgi:DNA sulfur modification protein DndB
MSNLIAGSIEPKLFASFEAAWTAAQQFTFGTNGQHFVGTLFQQGGRHMFSTAMQFERFISVAEANSSVVRYRTEKRGDDKVIVGTVGDSVDEISETTNRPVDKAHVRAISKYISDSARNGENYIIPPATLNLRGEPATLFSVEGESTIRPAVLVLPPHARFEITDAQHRRQGIQSALADPQIRRQLLRDGIAVMVTFENSLSQVHQDFADASKTKQIAGSLVAVYDGRLPVNALAIHLAKTCPLFRYTIDATSKGSSLSAGSVKVWNANVLRQFVKYAGLNSREGDDIWNSKFIQTYGDHEAASYKKFRGYLVEFIDLCTEHVPLFKILVELAPDDLSTVPKLRAQDGGQILMTAPGMNILGAIAYDLYRPIYKQDGDLVPWIEKLGKVCWSYDGSAWKETLLRAGRVSVSAKDVRSAIVEIEQQIGLTEIVSQSTHATAANSSSSFEEEP